MFIVYCSLICPLCLPWWHWRGILVAAHGEIWDRMQSKFVLQGSMHGAYNDDGTLAASLRQLQICQLSPEKQRPPYRWSNYRSPASINPNQVRPRIPHRHNCEPKPFQSRPISAQQRFSSSYWSWHPIPPKTQVLATGFSLTQYDVQLIGRNSRTRSEHWNDFGYKEAYKSIAMSGYPNFFYVLGPNSGKCHTSTIYSIEKWVICFN